MINYFSKSIIKAAKKHAINEFPKESCGIVVNNIYNPCKNIAQNPDNNFKIHTSTYLKYERLGKIQCIIHSHNDFAMASMKDMTAQINTAVPWGIINLINKVPHEVLFWGDQLEIQELYGRPFHSGIYDCFTLVRDIAKIKYNVILPNVPREWDFWNNPEAKAHFEEGLSILVPKEMNFVDKNSGLEEGDFLLFKLNRSKVWNHSAIYIGQGLMAHHLARKLSRREPVLNWMKVVDAVIRPIKVGKL